MDIPLITVLILLLYCHCSVIISSDITVDRAALLALKTRVTSDPNSVVGNWTIQSPVCSWIGVRCGKRHNRVIGLNVSNARLVGTIPPDLGNLSFIVSLDISFNKFRNTLPEDLVRLRRLRFMSLAYNNFSGEVPSQFSSLSQLKYLSLRNNSFTGLNSFLHSSANGSNLAYLAVAFNLFRGEVPESLGYLHRLQTLYMHGNGFSGPIPSSITNMSSLQDLDLSQNSFQGLIPDGFGNLHELSRLNLQYNQLNGSIPLGIFNISSLVSVSFSNNKLSGTLPDNICIGNPLLTWLYVSNNTISGHFPSNISSCSQLRVLSMPHNKISGSIPQVIGSLEMLQTLYLRSNILTGPIPTMIGNLQNLRFLSLGYNALTGHIPLTISNLSNLQYLSLKRNKLNGLLIEEIGNLTMLQQLYLGENNFTGLIPQAYGKLEGLEQLDLGINNITGEIPPYIFNMSTLTILALTVNGLSGSLPMEIGTMLHSLQQLFLGKNDLFGVMPSSILNFSQLELLDLSNNNFKGPIPNTLGSLKFLQWLNLEGNHFTASPELSFLNSMISSNSLTFLSISSNPLNGTLPSFSRNFSSSLRIFRASLCNIKGNIPSGIANLSGVGSILLDGNDLSGTIPSSLGEMSNLQELHFENNRLRGLIPNGLCKFKSLGAMFLDRNQLVGSIPECLENVSSLRQISLSSNNLTSTVPVGIWSLINLLELNVSSNFLNGSLSPQIGNLMEANLIDLSMNQFTDTIPNVFEGLQSVVFMSLAYNRFQGPIPGSISKMLSLNSLDLSHNMLSGTIPKSLESMTQLRYFNVSHNELSGEIPSNGAFKNFTSQSFASNSGLCGLARFQAPPCKDAMQGSMRRKELRLIFIILGSIIAFICITITVFLVISHHKKKISQTASDAPVLRHPQRFSYYELSHATNGYSEDNLLGRGGFGSVYKGVLEDGTTLAIKVFNLEMEGAFKSFDAECEVLRNLRHRNLIEVVSACSNQDFKALVLEYMPNGSLEKWLYSDNNLDIVQRLNIMIDMASALEYLHHGYSPSVVHCDLKPSNVLMDENMVPHVSDFGITRFLDEDETIIHTNTFATLGYMAPEYGLEGRVSTRCDVYSFGIMLLETYTRKKPSDEMFVGDKNLKSWVIDSICNAPCDVIDANLINGDQEMNFNEKMRCALSVLELALRCCTDSSVERMNMKDVLVELKKIKLKFITPHAGTTSNTR